MSNLNYSGFLSNLINTSYGSGSFTDILSTVSDASPITVSSYNSSYTYYGRYFCLGDLLIQFSDNSSFSTYTTFLTQTDWSVNYPYPYDSTPYAVFVNGFAYGSAFPINTTVKTFNNSGFTFNLSTQNGFFTFLVIGPRPSSL